MIKSIILTGSVLCFLFCMSCVKQVGKKPVPDTAVITLCDTVTFSKSVKPIIMGNCAISGCHVSGGTGQGNFTVFDELKEKVSSGKFKLRVFDSPNNNPMPASGMLPQAQLDILKCWLDKGANND
jgi:hypothetical protein